MDNANKRKRQVVDAGTSRRSVIRLFQASESFVIKPNHRWRIAGAVVVVIPALFSVFAHMREQQGIFR